MSVAIAVVLWLIVVNIDNPTGTNYYTLNDVELINKEYVESSDTIGKMCMPEFFSPLCGCLVFHFFPSFPPSFSPYTVFFLSPHPLLFL